MEAAIISGKERLRRDARAARQRFVAALGADERAALEQAIAARAAELLNGAAVIASYAPMGHEVDPAPCARSTPARVVLPWFESRAAPMQFRAAGGSLEPGPFGTLQPLADAATAIPDVILVPLVAADLRLHRLGQGKGHFDRTLAALRTDAPLVAIGLAWDVQIFEALPADIWDERLDAVITPTRTLTV